MYFLTAVEVLAPGHAPFISPSSRSAARTEHSATTGPMTATLVEEVATGIRLVDTAYHRPRFAASYLLTDQGRAAFVETGSGPAAAGLLEVLGEVGLAPEAVDWVVVSHVHLDHAGAAGSLLARLPNARLVVHPSGAPHLIDPTRLVASTQAVYGADEFARLHGEIVPVPVERVLEAHDGLRLPLGNRALTVLDTPGHARHHLCLWDEANGAMFTGDTFGISYREFDTNGQVFLFPATTPTQFDPQAIHKSIDRIATFQPQRVLLTHFGAIAFNRWLADELHRQVDRLKALALGAHKTPSERHARIKEAMGRLFVSRLRRLECPIPTEQALELLAMDLELNTLGLESWLDRDNRDHAFRGRRPYRFQGP